MTKRYSTSGASYDEEEVTADKSYIAEDPSVQKDDMYNEEEYLAEVGEMNCYCVPTRVSGMKDFMFSTLGWTILNKEQILAAFTGEMHAKRTQVSVSSNI
jgi:hypothetical protein